MPKCLKRKFTIGSDVSLHIRFSHIRKNTANSDAHLHYHPTPEFYLVLNGICRILLNNTIHLMQRGTVIWLAPKQIHVICEQSFDFSFIICQLKNQFLKKFENPETLPQKTAFYKLSEQELSYLEHFFSTLPPQKEAAYDIAMRYAADHLIRLFKQTTEPDQRLLHPGIEKVVRFLMQEKQKVPLKELCRLAAMSPTHLQQMFKTQMDMTITDFRNHQQVRRFLTVYNTGKRFNLSEAVYQSGFGSYAQFYRIFSKITGYTPREYQRICLQERQKNHKKQKTIHLRPLVED